MPLWTKQYPHRGTGVKKVNYEFFDLCLILINLLFCAMLFHKVAFINKRIEKIEDLISANIKNPKLARKMLNQLKK